MQRFFTFLLVLFTAVPFAVAQESIAAQKNTANNVSTYPIQIEWVNQPEVTSYDREEVQLLRFEHNPDGLHPKNAFFLDEKDQFLVDFTEAELSETGFDSVIIDISGYPFYADELRPFLVKGLKAGGHTIAIKRYRNGEIVKFPFGVSHKIKFKTIEKTPVIKKDSIVLGILIVILALIFYTSGLASWKRFYTIVPALLLCYFVPAILNSLNLISGDYTNLYYVASRYLLPASLILLCLSIDLKGIRSLGPKALVMFFTATAGIVIGGPIALLLCSYILPDLNTGEELYRGLSTVAGSWIGGGANQTAMKEIYQPSTTLFSQMIVVDVLVANVWMAFLLYGASITKKIDKWLNADASAIETLKTKLEGYSASIRRVPSTTDIMIICGIGLGGTALSHFGADVITDLLSPFQSTLESIGLNSFLSGFFWLVVIATTIGIILSFTKLRKFEGAGASRIGSVFLYVLVATIGMHMDITQIFKNPGLFAIGFVWMAVHVILLIIVAKLTRSPFFFVAVGSQANVGGAASAPIVASAFSPALAPVGVLLAVLGYALGTYGAILCAEMMKWI